MDITLNEDQRMLLETAGSFARDAFDADRARSLETSEIAFDGALWKRMAELGLAGAPFPVRHGGSELTLLDLGLIIEVLAANALATPMFATVVEAGLLLAECGTQAQQESWLPAIAAGKKILTAAYLETSVRFEPFEAETALEPSGDEFRLTGRKRYVREAGAADGLLCLARFAGGEFALAIVGADANGVRRRRMPAAGGESLWSVEFDDAVIPPGAVIQGNGIAAAIARLEQRGAALKACELVGIGQAVLDLTIAYAATRTQFGKPLGSFQAVQHHCADMQRDISITRLLARQACAALDESDHALREVSFAKAKASEAMPAVTRMAHQIHGAVGYYRDYPLELYYHRAIAAQAAFGDGLHHRRALAEMLESDMDSFRGDGRHDL